MTLEQNPLTPEQNPFPFQSSLRQDWVDRAHQLLYSALPDVTILYIALKGSRLWGIYEPNSDVDLRIIFQTPTDSLFRLDPPPHTIERMDSSTDPPIDFVAYEVQRFMYHLRRHNGNMVETLCVPEGYYVADGRGALLRLIGAQYLTRQLHKFHRGYANGQFQRACKQVRTGKGLIAVYRELFVGLHLLTYGWYEFSWPKLVTVVQENVLGWHSSILPHLHADRTMVTDGLLARVQKEYDFLEQRLDEAYKKSPLPETYNGTAQLDEMLVTWRRGLL